MIDDKTWITTARIAIVIGLLLAMLIAINIAMGEGPTGVKPSTLIEIEKLPGVISLSGTTESSLYAISETNAELKKTIRWEMPDIGYLFSYSITATQEENEVTTDPIMKFLGTATPIPESVQNETNETNVTKPTEANGLALLYL